MMDDLSFRSTEGNVDVPGVTELYLCALVGIGVTALLFVITDYYTSTRFSPVKKTAAASQTGHATNIIQGLAQGLQATALPRSCSCSASSPPGSSPAAARRASTGSAWRSWASSR